MGMREGRHDGAQHCGCGNGSLWRRWRGYIFEWVGAVGGAGVSEKEASVHVDVPLYCIATPLSVLRSSVELICSIDSCIVQHEDWNTGFVISARKNLASARDETFLSLLECIYIPCD